LRSAKTLVDRKKKEYEKGVRLQNQKVKPRIEAPRRGRGGEGSVGAGKTGVDPEKNKRVSHDCNSDEKKKVRESRIDAKN